MKAIKESKPWSFARKDYHTKVKEVNDRLMMAERAFTDPDGLFHRKWYKHLVISFFSSLLFMSSIRVAGYYCIALL